MSERERISWVELIAKLVAGSWYFGHILSLPTGADLLDPKLAMWLVWPIIVVSIVCGALMRVVQKRTGGGSDAAQHDERDSLINLRATRIAFGVFTVAVGAVWMLVMLIERERSYRDGHGEPATVLELLSTGPLQVMHVAQLLLLSGLLASITLNASRIFYYRRGY